jgi:hypothetical protein
MVAMRHPYAIPYGKRAPGRPARRREDNIEMGHKRNRVKTTKSPISYKVMRESEVGFWWLGDSVLFDVL